MVIQTAAADGKKTDVTFTIKREDLLKTLKLIEKNKQYLNYRKIIRDDKVSKVSIIGAAMVANPGIVGKMFSALGSEKINILAISTSEIKISVLIQENMTQAAVKALHKKFELDQ
jgi:aspartate kinase